MENNIKELYENAMESINLLAGVCIEESPEMEELLMNVFEDAADALKDSVCMTTGICPCCGETAEEVPGADLPNEVMHIGVEMDTEDNESRIRLNLYSPQQLLDTTVWFDCIKTEKSLTTTEYEVSPALIEALRELADQLERKAK